MTLLIRGEQFSVTYGQQFFDDGVLHTGVETADRVVDESYLTNIFGIFSSATLPDPSFEFTPHWAYGTASKRNWYITYKGKATMGGSISDILLLNGAPIYLPFGTLKTTGTDVVGGGGGTLNGGDSAKLRDSTANWTANEFVGRTVTNSTDGSTGTVTANTKTTLTATLSGGAEDDWDISDAYSINTSPATTGTHDGGSERGEITIEVSSATDYATSDVIQIGTGDNAECRTISGISGTTFTLDYPLSYNHAHGETLNEVEAPFTHTTIESLELDPIQIDATYIDTDAANTLMRRYVGCKVGRASLSASEGEPLTLSIDDIQARDIRYEDKDGTDVSPWYSSDLTKPTPSCPTTEPYYFSYGQLTFAGSEVARVTEFRLEVNNNLEPKYYVNDDVGTHRVPYGLVEGKKEYTMSVTVDIEDAAMYLDLLRQGDYSSVYTGFQVIMVFTRGTNDTITITTPPSTPAAGGDAQGCLIKSAPHNIVDAPLVNVPLDISCRSVQVVTVDSVATYA